MTKRNQRHTLTVHPEANVPGDEIAHMLRIARTRRRQVDKTVSRLISKLELYDRDDVRGCMHQAGTFKAPHQRDAQVFPIRCRNVLCPFCPETEDYRIRRFQGQRLASVTPTEHDARPDEQGDPELRLRNVVLSIPSEAWQWTTTHAKRAFLALMEAQGELLAEVYNVKAEGQRSRARVAATRYGGTTNIHLFGSKDPLIPKPHLDTLIAGWRRNADATALEAVPARWPEKYATTRLRWQRLATKHLTKAGLPIEIQAALLAHEKGFVVNVGQMVTGRKAWHRVKYSSRSMLDLGNASVFNDAQGREMVEYTIKQKGHEPIHAEFPIGPFVSLIYRYKWLLEGSELHRHFGIMNKASYPKSARLAGRTPIRKDLPKGHPDRRKLLRKYVNLGNGYEPIEPGERGWSPPTVRKGSRK